MTELNSSFIAAILLGLLWLLRNEARHAARLEDLLRQAGDELEATGFISDETAKAIEDAVGRWK